MTQVSALIRRARVGADLTQTELADLAGTSQPALARYEAGETLPTLPTLERLLRACGRRLDLRSVRADASVAGTSIRGRLGTRAEKLRRQRKRLLDCAHLHGIRKVRVFGSVARNDDLSSSDVDFLVDLEHGRTLLDLAAFRREAAEILDMPVDVALPDMLKPRVRAEVLREALPL